ncbi:hypothetical protein DFP74_2090 [Nocardiopsis sp. Huas11]|uniref:hypothetical protein n=1 Tax=Nocardiopsis sp. Huas11 TaxID=2183912 RepID=UPI000EB3537E|nr:hypothetical protein [Nocardiopsis sp. Huas11]RKS06458.1 hypothetical protein DFP74_2090 [Nocardiopsis sp. Huas11]
MSGARAVWVRGGLVFFTLVFAVLGAYILISPEGFFGWAWVNLGMAYNPHLMLDYGAMNLAAAIPLGAAAATMNPVFVRSALASFAVWAVAHLLIHVRLRSHLVAHASIDQANLLLCLLTVGAVVPLVLLLLTFGGRAEAQRRERMRAVD